MGITDELRTWAQGLNTYNRNELQALAIADRIDAEHEAMLEDARKNVYEGYVELPKDADGEYIRMGDRMENGELVARIVLTDGSWEPTIYTAATPNQLHEYYCHDIRHSHQPTVEDVLCELLDKVDDDRAGQAEIIAEYAAKLRLAGDE